MRSTVDALQNRVNTALLNGDWATLTELVASDAQITGPRGFKIDRDEWIDVHKGGDYRQVRLEVTQTGVQAYDGAWRREA
jgi:hypothetical protein